MLAFAATRPTAPAADRGPLAPAAPSVRRLARELGVDLHQVPGTGPGGRISQDDVKTFTKHVMSSLGGGGQANVATLSGGSVALPDFSKWGAVERKAMSGIRRKTAEHLSHAWNAIPHVTQFDKADITQLEQVRKKFRPEVEKAGGNLTVTAIAAKVVASALKVFPQFNASVDAAGQAIVYKKYIHVGIAVDTENGLLVPVIRNADQKNLTEISIEIQALAEKAKARKLTSTRCRAARCRSPTSAASAAPPSRRSSTGPRWRSSASRAAASSRCGTAPRSSRGRCCRCRSATTTG